MSTTPKPTKLTARLTTPLPTSVTSCSGRELGRRLRMSPSTARRQIITNEIPVTLDTIGRLCGAFQLLPADLITLIPLLIDDDTDTEVTPAQHIANARTITTPTHTNAAPWKLTPGATPYTYPLPTPSQRPIMPANPTPADKIAFDRQEYACDWAAYRHYASEGDFLRASVQIAGYLRKPFTAQTLQEALTKTPTTDISHMVKIPRKLVKE